MSGSRWQSWLAKLYRMCAKHDGKHDDQYPNRWSREFESLAEITAFAYGDAVTLIELALRKPQPRAFLREQLARHKAAYNDSVSHFFKMRDIERKARVNRAIADSNSPRHSNGR